MKRNIISAADARSFDIMDYIFEDIEKKTIEASLGLDDNYARNFVNYSFKFPRTVKSISYSGQIVDAVAETLVKNGYEVKVDYGKSGLAVNYRGFAMRIDWENAY